VALPAIWLPRKRSRNRPLTAMTHFLPMEEVRNLTNHMDTYPEWKMVKKGENSS
jgi:hypothetical protein